MAINLITDKSRWDSFVDGSPYGLLYHKWDFLKLIEKYTGYELLPYGISKGEELIGLFPLYFKKIAGIKMLFSPPPQSGVPYLGLVMYQEYDNLKQDKKESCLNLVVTETHAEIKKIGPNYFSVTLVPDINDARPFKWLNYDINLGYTYTINLKQEVDYIWNSFSSNCRHNIRKGKNAQCKLVRSEDTAILTGFLSERYSEQGLTHNVAPDYLKELLKTYPDDLALYCLSADDEIIGATLNHEYKRYIGWMGLAKARDERNRYVNEFMVWQLVQQAKAHGFTKFEMCGANKPSLCKYRAKFNPLLEMYFEISKKDAMGKMAEAVYLNFVKKAKLSLEK